MDALKVCKTCCKEKNIEEFPIERKRGMERRRPRCRDCFLTRKRENGKAERARRGDIMRLNEAEYRKNNREKLKENYNRWRENHPEKCLEQSRKSYRLNREKRNKATRAWEKNNPDKVKMTRKRNVEKRKISQPETFLVERIKKTIRLVIKTEVKKYPTLIYTGCSSPYDFLEKMTAKTDNPNWVQDGYEIDHIMQRNWFRNFIDDNLDKVEEVCMVFSHHSNLRPLLPKENRARSFYDFFGCEALVENNRAYLNKGLLAKFDFYMQNRHLFKGMILKCSDEERILINL